ncbi:hypothetical protein AB0J55_43940 [Amycolatopsis sp. NPDC049688]|uniref:hypothetical protein n=1 Tax=Amycolatopsis sp. NPDC049688 TaxID=3154733 RepID=UPI0034477EFE
MRDKLAATAAFVGTAVLGGVAAAAPVTATTLDAGIALTSGHNVGAYAVYAAPIDANKIAPNLLYSPNPSVTDGIDADCYTSRGYPVNGHDNRWYHTMYLYYNHNGVKLQKYTWTYAPYVDNSAVANEHLIPDCQY